MSRPTDWWILDRDSDPAPGDPGGLRELARAMRQIGDDAETAAREVRQLASDPTTLNWIGASGDAFKGHIGKFPAQPFKKPRTSENSIGRLIALALCTNDLGVFWRSASPEYSALPWALRLAMSRCTRPRRSPQ